MFPKGSHFRHQKSKMEDFSSFSTLRRKEEWGNRSSHVTRGGLPCIYVEVLEVLYIF